MLTDILVRTVSKLSNIVIEILDEKQSRCVFEPLLLATYTVHFMFIGKLLLDHFR